MGCLRFLTKAPLIRSLRDHLLPVGEKRNAPAATASSPRRGEGGLRSKSGEGAVFSVSMLVLALGASQAIAAPTASTVVGNAIDGFVLATYVSLVERSEALSAGMKTLCGEPSAQHAADAQAAFAATVDAWSRAEIVRVGPITEDNRLDRMLYFPDRKGIGLKQVQAAIANADQTATDTASLAQKSVAMQGLGALEFVLYGTGSEVLVTEDGAYRCAYGAAIAGNVEAMAAGTLAGWQKPDGFAAIWKSPGATNPLYRDGTEAVTELVEIFVNGLEMIRDVRVKSFLDDKAEADKPKQAIYWRSGQTVASLAANIAAMRDLFDASGLREALPEDQAWIAESIDFEFGNAIRAAEAAEGPTADVLADPEKRGKLAYFALVTTSLSELFGTRLSGAFGLTAGFSSLDGD